MNPYAVSVARIQAHELHDAQRDLLAAMLRVYLLVGFTDLRLINASAEGEIARGNRTRLAAEGWIA